MSQASAAYTATPPFCPYPHCTCVPHRVCVYICCVAQQVKGVILDPSCSGSGTTVSRMDHLLPSSSTAGGDDTGGGDAREQQRVEQLAKFQVRTPPLHFTCSSCIHHTTPHHAHHAVAALAIRTWLEIYLGVALTLHAVGLSLCVTAAACPPVYLFNLIVLCRRRHCCMPSPSRPCSVWCTLPAAYTSGRMRMLLRQCCQPPQPQGLGWWTPFPPGSGEVCRWSLAPSYLSARTHMRTGLTAFLWPCLNAMEQPTQQQQQPP